MCGASHIGTTRNAYRILLGKLDGKRPLRRLRIGGIVILKWILKAQNVCGFDSSGST
jgi:1,6-anhydro-N-acetylmuramate kinase